MRASHISLMPMLAIAFVGVVMTVALKKQYWEFELFGNAVGFAYLLSIIFMGARDEKANESYPSKRPTSVADQLTKTAFRGISDAELISER
jgi:hypothetical protein